MKIYYLLAGLLLGAVIGYLGSGWRQDPVPREMTAPPLTVAPLESDKIRQAEVENRRLRERNDVLINRIEDLESVVREFEKSAQAEQKQMAAEKEQWVTFQLKKYRGLFDLTEEQSTQIGDWDWEEHMYWKAVRTGQLKADSKRMPLDDKIRSVLDPGQLEIFEKHVEARTNAVAESGAQSYLSQYPVTLDLTESQKDAIYETLFYLSHPTSRPEYRERLSEYSEERGYGGSDAMMMMAAEEVLDEEQMRLLEEAFEVRRKK